MVTPIFFSPFYKKLSSPLYFVTSTFSPYTSCTKNLFTFSINIITTKTATLFMTNKNLLNSNNKKLSTLKAKLKAKIKFKIKR